MDKDIKFTKKSIGTKPMPCEAPKEEQVKALEEILGLLTSKKDLGLIDTNLFWELRTQILAGMP